MKNVLSNNESVKYNSGNFQNWKWINGSHKPFFVLILILMFNIILDKYDGTIGISMMIEIPKKLNVSGMLFPEIIHLKIQIVKNTSP